MHWVRIAGCCLLLTVWIGHLSTIPLAQAKSQEESLCFNVVDVSFECIRGRFLDYWLTHGGLPQLGYPLTGEYRELLEDGNEYTVQYFERARLELHPEHQAPFDLLLGQFGRRMLNNHFARNLTGYEQALAPVAPERHFFSQTGHNVDERFFAYWQANDGLSQFGLPLTEAFNENLYGGVYRVQYFERARLEYHPENQPPYDILLGLFGQWVHQENAAVSQDFRPLYLTNERVRKLLAAPQQYGAVAGPGLWQSFEHGLMIAKGYTTPGNPNEDPEIYVLCGAANQGQLLLSPAGTYFADPLFDQTAPNEPAPAPGSIIPQHGFGRIWRNNAAVRDCLGNATAPETKFTIRVQQYASGTILQLPTTGGAAFYVLHLEQPCPTCAVSGLYEQFPIPAR